MSVSWNSRVASVKASKAAAVSEAVAQSLENIRGKWAPDVRVDTGHFKETIESTPAQISGTAGYISLPPEDYFYVNEFGSARMTARPSMRQAVAAEASNFMATIDKVIKSGI